jgi:hypothetical protein
MQLTQSLIRLALTIALAAALLVALLAAGSMPADAQSKPEYRLGFKVLAGLIPAIAGDPVESEHYGANGDSLQLTARGLMVWRKADNWTAFTDGEYTWINGPLGLQKRHNSERLAWEGAATTPTPGTGATQLQLAPQPGNITNSTGLGVTPTATPVPYLSKINSINGKSLILNMHGALFHSEPRDFQENVSYARWMNAGVIRVFATDNNSNKNWDGVRVGNRIAEVAPYLRAANIKLIVALVNNHKPVPGEAANSSGWMDGYYQLLLPFYTTNWRGAYLQFARDLIGTVRARQADDVIYAWELGNELHTPQDPKAIIPFATDMVQEIRKLDARTPILPGTMGTNHLEPWNVRSSIARWFYCDAAVDAYTLHAYDWSSKDQQGDMPISWDLDYTTLEPCPNGRKLPVIVEELGTSRTFSGVYSYDQELKRVAQELKQMRYVQGYSQVIGIGAWNGESPKVVDRSFYDNRRGLTSYGTGAAGGGSLYDPQPEKAVGFRGQLEQILRGLPYLPPPIVAP